MIPSSILRYPVGPDRVRLTDGSRKVVRAQTVEQVGFQKHRRRGADVEGASQIAPIDKRQGALIQSGLYERPGNRIGQAGRRVSATLRLDQRENQGGVRVPEIRQRG